jgi:hypothetical protein
MSTMKRVLTALVTVLLGVLLFSAGPASAAPGKPTPAPASGAASTDTSASDRGVSARAVSAAGNEALAALQRRIAAHVASHGTAYTFGSYLDAVTGKIVLETNAPASVVSSLVQLPGVSAAATEAAHQTQVRRVATSDAFHRRDDIPSFYGGGGISNGSAICSSGYAVRNSVGTIRMTTAGHCYANGTTVRTESLARIYGTVSGRHLASLTFDAKDMELMSGQSYAGRIFTGGVTSSSSLPVYGAGSAVVGFTNYCHSGRTTGEQCGHTARSVTAQVCTTTGCKSPVIAFTGGVLSQGGDSGSPFFVRSNDGLGVHIRGHVIAGSSTTSYAETWNKVASTYGVSVVTQLP